MQCNAMQCNAMQCSGRITTHGFGSVITYNISSCASTACIMKSRRKIGLSTPLLCFLPHLTFCSCLCISWLSHGRISKQNKQRKHSSVYASYQLSAAFVSERQGTSEASQKGCIRNRKSSGISVCFNTPPMHC